MERSAMVLCGQGRAARGRRSNPPPQRSSRAAPRTHPAPPHRDGLCPACSAIATIVVLPVRCIRATTVSVRRRLCPRHAASSQSCQPASCQPLAKPSTAALSTATLSADDDDHVPCAQGSACCGGDRLQHMPLPPPGPLGEGRRRIGQVTREPAAAPEAVWHGARYRRRRYAQPSSLLPENVRLEAAAATTERFNLNVKRER